VSKPEIPNNVFPIIPMPPLRTF